MVGVRQETGQDCFRACLASILELELRDVPNFSISSEEMFTNEVREWLDKIGIVPMAFECSDYNPFDLPTYAIAKLRDSFHCVVVRGRIVVWDPTTGRGEYERVDVETYMVLIIDSMWAFNKYYPMLKSHKQLNND